MCPKAREIEREERGGLKAEVLELEVLRCSSVIHSNSNKAALLHTSVSSGYSSKNPSSVSSPSAPAASITSSSSSSGSESEFGRITTSVGPNRARGLGLVVLASVMLGMEMMSSSTGAGSDMLAWIVGAGEWCNGDVLMRGSVAVTSEWKCGVAVGAPKGLRHVTDMRVKHSS